MSQPPQRNQAGPTPEPAPERDEQPDSVPEWSAPPPEEPTVGTGSVVAIGCVIAMLLVLVLGILIVLWTQ